jgi:polar amino acid transport system permease protein
MQFLSYAGYLAKGIPTTVLVFIVAYLLTIAFAFLAGIARAQKIPVLNGIAFVYIEIFRGTSLLVQLFWIYFTLPLLGISIGAMTAAFLGLSLNSGAYGAEIVRGAILAVPQEQYEAAIALNLSRRRTLWRVVIPQAVLEMIPPFGNLAILVLKDTALVSMITIADVAFRAQELRMLTLDSTSVYTLSLLIYFAISLAVVFVLRLVERRVRPRYLHRSAAWLGSLP